VAGYKINLQKSLAEKDYMETIPFTTASKIQIPGSKLNKGCELPL
jgi:hypothetical protein